MNPITYRKLKEIIKKLSLAENQGMLVIHETIRALEEVTDEFYDREFHVIMNFIKGAIEDHCPSLQDDFLEGFVTGISFSQQRGHLNMEIIQHAVMAYLSDGEEHGNKE